MDWYRRRMQIALEASNTCIFEVDLIKQKYVFFENAESIFEKSGEEILAEIREFEYLSPEEYEKAASEYFSHPEDKAVIAKAFAAIFDSRSYTYEARMKAGNQKFTWCRLTVTPVLENGILSKMIGSITNIQQERERFAEMETTIHKDSFTLLANKERLIELTDLILGENRERVCTMIVMDLDHFKKVNDTYGHDAGDEVLLSVANHLKKIFVLKDLVARFGGDEFAVLLLDCDSAGAIPYVERFLAEEDNPYHVTKSVGIATRTKEDEHFKSLFKKADEALYEAKKERNRYILYQESEKI